MEWDATQVEVAYERDDAALEVEGPLSLLVRSWPLVDQRDAQAFGQIGHLAEALGQRLVAVLDARKDRPIGHEGDGRAVGLFRIADTFHGVHRDALDVLLLIQPAV